MASNAPEGGERRKTGRADPVPGWMRHLPLVTGVLLAALLVIPLWLRQHTSHVRERVTDVALPARNALLEVQIAFASELAAIRGFELTGNREFLRDFSAGIEKDRVASRKLIELAEKLGPEAAAAVIELDSRKREWLAEPNEALAGRRSREELIKSLGEGERRVDGVLVAADKANTALITAEAEMREIVASDQRLATALVSLLALAALAVISVVGWLVHRLNLVAAQAEEAVLYRDQMVRVVSHDLKNPLHTIGMSVDLLATIDMPESKREEQLRIVMRAIDRMNRLIHDLLDAARVQSGRALSIAPTTLNTRELLTEATDLFLVEAESKKIRLQCEADSAPPTVCADHDRILQVFSNLVGNALKFTREGGLVRVNAAKGANGGVQFAVCDTGPGIPAEDLSHLFEPFWQATDGARLGTGLGLSIARGIVIAHGGHISVRSVPGEGTTFEFDIPAGNA
ncbi:MAG TPA: ATP-binding protein [Gemmatimonadaceae bacterium]